MIWTPYGLHLHVPGTGGRWVRAALENAGVRVMRLTGAGRLPSKADDPALDGLPAFCFIRDPSEWFATLLSRPWAATKWLRLASYRSIDEFIDRLPPGRIKEVYQSFESESVFVGDNATLADDLVAYLQSQNARFDEAKLRATPPRGVTPPDQRITLTPDQQQRIRAAEPDWRDLIKRS